MKLLKKISAGIVALAMSTSLFGCGEGTTWAAKSGDITIPAGIFIYYEMSSYYEALNLLKEDDETVTKVTKNDKVEDTPALEWIQNKSFDKMRQYIAVENKFNELGLTLSEEDESSVDSMVQYYMSYYADNYTENGISEDSLRKAFLSDYKYSAIFQKYYVEEDGLEPVAESDIKDFYKDEFARVKMVEIKLKDGSGNLLKGEDKEDAIEMAEDYLKRAKDGEDFDDLIAEYTEYYDQLVIDAEEAEENNAGAADPDSAVQSDDTTASDESMDPAETTAPDEEEPASDSSTATTTAPKGEAEDADATTTTTAAYANEIILHKVDGISDKTSFSDKDGGYIAVKNSDTYSEKLINTVFKGALNSPFLVEDEESYYVVLRTDILALTDIYDNERENIIWEMKEEDFKEIIDELTLLVELEKNTDAFKRYNPFKLKV